MSVRVHYRKNENLALLNTVNNALRETVYKTAPDIFFYDRPRSWVIDNVLDGGKQLDTLYQTFQLSHCFISSGKPNV